MFPTWHQATTKRVDKSTKMMLGMSMINTTMSEMDIEMRKTSTGKVLPNQSMGTRPTRCLVYEKSAAGTHIAYEAADYARLRTHSNSDPFIGIPPVDGEWTQNGILATNQMMTIENDPFGDLDEELPWLETFTDLNQYEDHFQYLPTSPLEEELTKKAAEVDWEEWDRFLRENHPVEYHFGSGPSSPLPSTFCEEYIPNFEVIESGKRFEEQEIQPPSQSRIPIEAFPEDFEIIEEFFEIEKEEKEEPARKPKRGRPRLPKPQRTHKAKRFNPYSDEEEDGDETNPSDVRRKALNRDAAFRYRERKKAQKEAASSEAQELESRNSWLTGRVSMLTSEIRRMRAHLKDMGAIE
ncbi:unnamed protein product, partial [Mesorhabditis belari]|uniref:BZIP domain-containing protein n=1 Tax=Mesorhabditis belari TaxID=2138241 RepID=A0AAF3ELL6_9BILA